MRAASTSGAIDAANWRLLAGVTLVSAALLITELSLTRIFSVTMYYHFAFLAISIALFGLSASGVYVYLAQRRFERAGTARLLSVHALAFALVTAVSLVGLVHVRVGLQYSLANLTLMSVIYLLAALPFFAGGAVISLAIARLSRRVNAVYAADLCGASAGCLLLLPLLNGVGGPAAILVASALAAAAACLCAPAGRRRPVLLIAVAVAGVPAACELAGLPLIRLGSTKGHVGDRVLFERWNSFSRVAVYDRAHGDWSLSPRYAGPLPDTRLMDIDSAASTPILRVSPDLAGADYLRFDLTTLAYHLMNPAAGHGDGNGPDGAAPPLAPKPFGALVIGSGGGRDLLSALIFGATRVDGVEINPIIVRDVMLDRFRAFSGGVYAHPRVTVHVEDGRSFVRRSSARYDVIQASLVDTWAATAAGAYTQTENTLYTVEAFNDYLDHLTDGGILTISRWRFDGLRLVSLAQEACAARGWTAEGRLAVVQYENVVNFLLKRTPFTAREIDQLRETSARLGFRVVYVPGPAGRPARADLAGLDRVGMGDYARLITTPDRHAFYRQYPLDLSPTTDDRPFFFHTTKLARQKYVAWARQRLFGEAETWTRPPPEGFATGGLSTLLMLMAISAVLVAGFVVGPLLVTTRATLVPGWARRLTYFGCLGAGCMTIEIALLQRFVLLLGHPVYSLTVTLFSLLLGTGLGSFLSRRIRDDHLRSRLFVALLGVVLVGLVAGLALPYAVAWAVGWPLAARIALAIGMLVPAGIVMGVPLPAGVRLLARDRPELIPWAWGINGALSVLGSGVAVLVAINWGFSGTLLGAAAVYAVAAALVSSGGAWG